MRLTVLINCYNYEAYVGEAVASVRSQTRPADEIVVVDDGSTDGSVAAVERAAGGDPRVRIVPKQNGGQLSALQAGYAAATGDICCFLDADDLHEPGYLAAVEQVYRQHPEVDAAYCGHRCFGQREAVEQPVAQAGVLGFTRLRTRLLGRWYGSVTSTLSFRRSALERFLPLPAEFEPAWRTRADDCLVFGSSLTDACKYAWPDPLVRYRVHGANHFAGAARPTAQVYRHSVALARLLHHFDRGLLPEQNTALVLLCEFRSIARPTMRDLLDGLAVWRRIRDGGRFRRWALGSMIKHFLRTRRSRP